MIIDVLNECILRSAAAIVIDLDTLSILGATPLADKVFGYIEGELINKIIHDLVPEGLREQHKLHVAEYSKHPTHRGMGELNQELVGLRKDGTIFPVEISLYPRVISGRRLVVATVMDVSHRRHNE